MKLIIAVVQDKFVNNLVRNFLKEEIKITKLSSTGGFLKRGNSTFFIGVEDQEVERAKNIIKKSVQVEIIKEDNQEVEVHGAHLFIVNVDGNIIV